MDIKLLLYLERALRTLESGKAVWTDINGRKHNIHDRNDVDDRYLNNIINMIERHGQEEEDEYLLWDAIGINDMDSCNL